MDNSCSATQPYTAELGSLAPASPTAVEQIQYLVTLFWLPVVIAVLVIAGAAFIGRRRWRDSPKA